MTEKLTDWHRRYPGGAFWRVTRDGVEVEGLGLTRTRGKPMTMSLFAQKFGGALRACGRELGVPAELILATLGTEGGPKLHAVRHEPRYAAHLVKMPRQLAVDLDWPTWAEKNNKSAVRFLNRNWRQIPVNAFAEADEATPHRVSIGIMHTLISTARATLDHDTLNREWLLKPGNAIWAGASYIALQRKKTAYDPPVVGAAYNAGGVYHDRSKNNRWRMRQYPIGTSRHVDRWVAFYNDAVFVCQGQRLPVTHGSYWFGGRNHAA